MSDAFAFLNKHIDVSRETFERLSLYYDLLVKWQTTINLVGPDTIPDCWNRHFLDSLQLIKYISDLSKPIIDIGTGAGFPGMALAIYGASDMHLVESDTKKIVFLNEVARVTNTRVSIHHARIENAPKMKVSVVVARALSDVKKLLDYSFPFVSHETICLFPKGKNYAMEIDDAKKSWSFDHDIFPSVTDSQGVIVRLSGVRNHST